ncbi:MULTISPECIES: hypothetical protein [Sinorhizobium]|uniref:Uncharacterized protein n=1 Tax=Sinorhizobium medicae TaxID=110321 RepID=A0ABX4TMP7_9HYPH|nr:MULTISPECIES: hypothetical protein [Sinorhizobium]PLU04546.1 hypothetical protein BMJ33_11840 [Sinorhizobium medicae]PLU20176.1 hypothetical protein BMJ29_13635 [Sinorhizobium medicae]PLU30892.1 hypothetical protein BMJ27_22695 [Sinorhizobium medicae]PLU81187.1 hypothetical protein BMJ19_03865 [Sinorhizobium medicae]RVN05304.1 hypothetical protein CN112_23355 [Sinorhizobium meliloti]
MPNPDLDNATEKAIGAALNDFKPKEEARMNSITPTPSTPPPPRKMFGYGEPVKTEPVGKRLAPVVDKAQAVLTEAQALCQHVTGVQALDQDPGKDDGSRGLAGQIDWQASLIEKKLDAMLQAIDTVRRKL